MQANLIRKKRKILDTRGPRQIIEKFTNSRYNEWKWNDRLLHTTTPFIDKESIV